MANSLLTASYLANIGCAVGCNMGFNGCAVQYSFGSDEVEMIFGDKDKLQLNLLSDQSARAFHDDYSCIRDECRIALPMSMLDKSVDSVSKHLTEKLLELVPTGPSGVRDIDWTLA